jgi:hypothetical protein
MGAPHALTGGYDNQRHQRSPHRASMSPSLIPEMENLLAGRRPPPSTPLSPLSPLSSGSATPTVSPPASSQSTPSSRRGSVLRRTASAGLETTAEEGSQYQQRTARQRQLHDHDHTRFGSGSSRRNGVVEPDHNPGDSTRSWIIYVLGGSYPENHPILTTPSLFTDSPTYEDMLLLSALLGPVKPPVASEADVAAAPGLFRIEALPTTQGETQRVVAVAVEGDETIVIAAEERCLVCLCEYEISEEARRIIKCGHLFHRECIDQVSFPLNLFFTSFCSRAWLTPSSGLQLGGTHVRFAGGKASKNGLELTVKASPTQHHHRCLDLSAAVKFARLLMCRLTTLEHVPEYLGRLFYMYIYDFLGRLYGIYPHRFGAGDDDDDDGDKVRRSVNGHSELISLSIG